MIINNLESQTYNEHITDLIPTNNDDISMKEPIEQKNFVFRNNFDLKSENFLRILSKVKNN